MRNIDNESLQTLTAALNKNDIKKDWRKILEVFLSLGLADMLQIQRFTGFDRDKIRRILKKYKLCGADMPILVIQLPHKTKRAGLRGRSPSIFRLGETGKQLLLQEGFKEAHLSQLKRESEINHAVLMLDIRLDALESGKTVITDKKIENGKKNIIRPDNLITIENGHKVIYETEQTAHPGLLRRIMSSIENKIQFFSALQDEKISRQVRMIVNTPPGEEFEKTVRIWSQACTIASKGEKLHFQLFAIPAPQFSGSDDFSTELNHYRWTEITASKISQNPSSEILQPSDSQISIPSALSRRSARQDHLLMTAIWQVFRENAKSIDEEFPLPEPEFFEIMELIYLASHDDNADILQQAAMPWASIYLLQQYFNMHPQLRKNIVKVLRRGGPSMRWNPTNILHRMQIVLNTFLSYHGWRTSGVLKVYPVIPSWDLEDSKTFGIVVSLRKPEILMVTKDGVLPDREETALAEKSLGWVLKSLFSHSERIGLGQVTFW
ncbi:MAG: hypothetical protein JEZ06_11845 [Anaerolineaceae bacterium]|nr:hypothetical protein [Anaerolineaceae bacterium]